MAENFMDYQIWVGKFWSKPLPIWNKIWSSMVVFVKFSSCGCSVPSVRWDSSVPLLHFIAMHHSLGLHIWFLKLIKFSERFVRLLKCAFLESNSCCGLRPWYWILEVTPLLQRKAPWTDESDWESKAAHTILAILIMSSWAPKVLLVPYQRDKICKLMEEQNLNEIWFAKGIIDKNR